MVVVSQLSSVAISPNDAHLVIVADTTPAGTVVLNTPTHGRNWVYVKNEIDDRSAISIDPVSGNIDGGSSLTLSWTNGVLLVFDGTNWWAATVVL